MTAQDLNHWNIVKGKQICWKFAFFNWKPMTPPATPGTMSLGADKIHSFWLLKEEMNETKPDG